MNVTDLSNKLLREHKYINGSSKTKYTSTRVRTLFSDDLHVVVSVNKWTKINPNKLFSEYEFKSELIGISGLNNSLHAIDDYVAYYYIRVPWFPLVFEIVSRESSKNKLAIIYTKKFSDEKFRYVLK